jgi:hypothetical protein
VSCLPCWRCALLGLWKACHEPVAGGVESVQPVGLPEMTMCRRNFCFFAAILSTCFCWIEGAWAEAVVVAVSFYSPFEQIVKKLNFVV